MTGTLDGLKDGRPRGRQRETSAQAVTTALRSFVDRLALAG